MNIYVGNLSEDVNEDDLREVFEAFGQVESVNIIKDKFNGKSRGFGFVEIPSRDEAQTAIKEADGKDLKGKIIKVNEARGTSQGGGRGHGGGSRGGGGRGGSSRGGGGRSDSRGGGRRY